MVLTGAKLAVKLLTWSSLGNAGNTAMTMMPNKLTVPASRKAVGYPEVSATNPMTIAPVMPPIDSQLSSLPSTFPAAPSTLRLA